MKWLRRVVIIYEIYPNIDKNDSNVLCLNTADVPYSYNLKLKINKNVFFLIIVVNSKPS